MENELDKNKIEEEKVKDKEKLVEVLADMEVLLTNLDELEEKVKVEKDEVITLRKKLDDLRKIVKNRYRVKIM